MPPLLGLAMLVLSAGVLVGSGTMLVAGARGHDWYSAEGARHMRRAGLTQGIALMLGAGGAAVLLAFDDPATAMWALPVGALVVALLAVLVVMVWRRAPLDPATREQHEGSAARRHLHLLFAVPLAAAGVVLVILGLSLDWLFGAAMGLPLVLLAGLFVVLVRADWPASVFRRRAEARRDR